MFRLSKFRYLQDAKSLVEAVRMMSDEGPDAAFVAGGTICIRMLKRRQQVPKLRSSGWRSSRQLRSTKGKPAEGMVLGAGLTLTEVREPPHSTRLSGRVEGRRVRNSLFGSISPEIGRLCPIPLDLNGLLCSISPRFGPISPIFCSISPFLGRLCPLSQRWTAVSKALICGVSGLGDRASRLMAWGLSVRLGCGLSAA